MKTRYFLFVIFSLLFCHAVAQTDRQLIRQGNKQYRLGNSAEAEVLYRKAVEKNPRNPQANYNLGNSLMLQRKDSLSVRQLESAAKIETNPIRRAQAYHNMGVICQQRQMFGEAIEAYKESLRNNPTDHETRYNLALCKRQQQQQQNQQNQNKDNKDNKSNKDNKDNQQKDQQKQDDQQKKDEQKKQDQQKQDEQKMSRENAEQMLNAAIQEEKQTQERMKKARQQAGKRVLQKNW